MACGRTGGLFVTDGLESNPDDDASPDWDEEVAALKGPR